MKTKKKKKIFNLKKKENICEITKTTKEDCIDIIKKSIEKYINSASEIDIYNKDDHYKLWLYKFSFDDYQNEYHNNESGNFYNYFYHELWDDYFDTDGFVIINHVKE